MRIRLAVVGRTAIYLHGGMLLFAGYMLLLHRGALLAIGMGSILVHECAHALASGLLGHASSEIEILPIGAMLRLEGDERIPAMHRLIILMAGPLMTWALCSLSLLLTRWGIISRQLGAMLLMNNLALLGMNLLPSMPLDGGNILFLILRTGLREHTARGVMRALSTLCGLACIGANVYLTCHQGGWNLSLSLAGCLMIYAGNVATRSNALHELQGFMDRKIRLEKRRTLPVLSVAALESLPLRQAVRQMHPRRYMHYWVMSLDMHLRGVLTESDVIERYLQTPGASLKDALDQAQGEKSKDMRRESHDMIGGMH